MKVSNSDYQPNTYPTVQNMGQTKNDSAVFTIDKSDSANNNKTPDIWTELRDKYDIRHASFEELCEVSKELYSAGQISFTEHAMLVFDWKRAAQGMDVSDLNLTPTDTEGKRDWVAEFYARAKKDFSIGNTKGYIMNQNLAKILEQLSR